MKKFIIAIAAVALATSPTWAFHCRAAVVQKVQVQKQVVKEVKVQQVVAVEKVKVAAIVTPTVQVTEFRAAVVAPYAAYTAPFVYGGQDTSRLERLERTVEKLADTQAQLLQRLTAPK